MSVWHDGKIISIRSFVGGVSEADRRDFEVLANPITKLAGIDVLPVRFEDVGVIVDLLDRSHAEFVVAGCRRIEKAEDGCLPWGC